MTSMFAVAATTRQEEEAEQFLWCMLGGESELNLAIVRDVLAQCGYEVEKALNVLLELSSPSEIWYRGGDDHQSNLEVLAGYTSEAHRSTISQQVSEFVKQRSKKRRSPKKEEPRTKVNVAKGAEYDAYRGTAKQHWDSAMSHYQKAATTYSNGSRAYASYLSEQAKVKAKLAREADEKASQEILKARNRDMGIYNGVITIDLHGQHVKQAMKLLKEHLNGTDAQSLRHLRVITGCGAGKSVLKQSVIRHVQNEGIKSREENPGAVLIKVAA